MDTEFIGEIVMFVALVREIYKFSYKLARVEILILDLQTEVQQLRK